MPLQSTKAKSSWTMEYKTGSLHSALG